MFQNYVKIAWRNLRKYPVYSFLNIGGLALGIAAAFVLMRDPDGAVTDTLSGAALDRALLHITKAKKDRVPLGRAMVVGGLIYGLINVRTDGDKILCATLDEQDNSWRIKTFISRF